MVESKGLSVNCLKYSLFNYGACGEGEWNMEDRILEEYIPLVQMVVAQMKKTLSNQADENELFSSGMTGLWDASRKFDPYQGAKFQTYAVQRIRGAILDGLRQSDHVSRSL